MLKAHVITDYNECDYITAGKVYESHDENITDDSGDVIFIMGPDWEDACAHLDNIGTWRWATEAMIRWNCRPP